jgi:hypothetical protein
MGPKLSGSFRATARSHFSANRCPLTAGSLQSPLRAGHQSCGFDLPIVARRALAPIGLDIVAESPPRSQPAAPLCVISQIAGSEPTAAGTPNAGARPARFARRSCADQKRASSSRKRLHLPRPNVSVRVNISEPNNGQALSTTQDARPRYTGERLLRERPKIYRQVVRLLGEGWSANKICKWCHVTTPLPHFQPHRIAPAAPMVGRLWTIQSRCDQRSLHALRRTVQCDWLGSPAAAAIRAVGV